MTNKASKVVQAFLKKTAATGSDSPRQSIPGFDYDITELSKLKDILEELNSSLEALVAAHRMFFGVKSSAISPDGKLGGNGYVQDIKEMKESFNSSLKILSDLSDTIADELKNPLWIDKVPDEEQDDIEEVIEEKEEIIESADEIVGDEDMEDLEDLLPFEESEEDEEIVTFEFPTPKVASLKNFTSTEKRIVKICKYILGKDLGLNEVKEIKKIYDETGNLGNLTRTASKEDKKKEFAKLKEATKRYWNQKT